MSTNKNYVIRFVNELVDFRIPEFESLASLFNFDFRFLEPPSQKPFLMIQSEESDEQKLLRILERSVTAQNLYELWVEGPDFGSFSTRLTQCKQLYDQRYENCSFRILVESFGKKISLATKVERIERLDGYVPFKGPINLNNPEESFYYCEYFGLDSNNVPEQPYQIIFGRWIADSHRKMLSTFSLKKRKFIANTSMDPTLAFLMSNIARVSVNDTVYDPFVGSGSLLVSAAYLGAYVCGTDIDYLLLHGLVKPSRVGVKKRDQDESVYANLKQYGLQSKYLDVIAGDSSLPLFRNGFVFDAIVTDPPYGKRESRERIGTVKENPNIPEECLATHVPSKLEYNIEDIYRDLLNFSMHHLKPGGRLLFWAPYSRQSQDESPTEWPGRQNTPAISFLRSENFTNLEQELRERFKHSGFKFISYSEQPLTSRYSRILIALERI